VTKSALGVFEYEYVLRDHLGNTRVTFKDSNNDGIVTSSDVCQINHYYPFGLNMDGNWNNFGCNSRGNKYQYNGKELNDELGLNWNDYGARFYDAAIGRWNTVDLMAEGYYRWSPYNYGINNPIINTDPDGNSVESLKNEYKVIVEGGIVTSVQMTGTKGGDVVDYITVVDMDKAPRADGVTTYKVDVEIEYTSGPGNIHKQKTEPTPGYRETHGKDDTDLEAYTWLIGFGEAKEISTIIYAEKRVSSKTLRKLWEKTTGKLWPKEADNPKRNQSVSHKRALEDGGDNSFENIEPMPWKEHHDMHKRNGDFKRWAKKK
jgi:RHS repeat-associated protein